MGAQKAYFGAAVAALVAFLSAVSGALGEGGTFGDLDTQTWINAILAAVVASGVTGGTVYGVKNRQKRLAPDSPVAEGGPVIPPEDG